MVAATIRNRKKENGDPPAHFEIGWLILNQKFLP
jgi:hypothetical protein